MGLSYPKINLETVRPQTLGSLLIKLSQSNFSLRSSDSYFILSYLITTVLFSDEESNTSTYREDSSRRPSSDDDAIRFEFCVLNFFFQSSLERNWQKIIRDKRWAIEINFLNYYLKIAILVLDDLAEFKNWSFAKCSVFGSSHFFVIRENLRGLIENLKHKIRPSVPAMTTLLMKIFKKMNPYDTQKLRKMVAKRRKYSKKLTTEKIRTQRKLFPKGVEIG